MKEQQTDYVLIGLKVLMGIIIILIIAVVFFHNNIGEILNPIKKETITDLSCQNKTLMDTAKCLVANTSTFYIYNISNSGKTLSEEQLRIEGGVCSHWAEYYKKQAEGLGFYAITPVMDVTKGLGHQITIISNHEGYVVIDQTKIIGSTGFGINITE